jgi:YegS/Rv2252/BmrU family lipid kinase
MTVASKLTPTVFVVLNPVAGIVNAQLMKRIIETRFHTLGWNTYFHITEAGENTVEIVKIELSRGFDLVVAAGGDGTIAAVAAGMVNSHVPLGIIPIGTWNAIARNLQIPFNPVRAINLMAGKHNIKKLDLMAVGNSIHAMNLSMGFSVSMIKSTSRSEKRKFGNAAYISNLIKQAFGVQMHRYSIEADGTRYRGRATEIFVANYGVVGLNAIESVLNLKPDDGKVDLLIFRARTILDLPAMFWQILIQRQKRAPKYRQISAARSLTIRTSPPVNVQADGELIGETPIKITVLPRSVRVIVP